MRRSNRVPNKDSPPFRRHIGREHQLSQKLALLGDARPRHGYCVAMRSRRTTEEETGAATRCYLVAGQSFEAPPLPPGLYLVATPIGNLRDITLRALEILSSADLVACEDTRVTRKLFDHYGLSAPLIPYHDHNAETARPKILEKLAAGAAVALVSDAD